MAINPNLGRAFNWIKDEAKPEIINFSNLLIASLAPTIKRELNIPIVVTLQGDDLFINELNNDHRNEVIRELKRIAESVDAFITFSEFYAQKDVYASWHPNRKVSYRYAWNQHKTIF